MIVPASLSRPMGSLLTKQFGESLLRSDGALGIAPEPSRDPSMAESVIMHS